MKRVIKYRYAVVFLIVVFFLGFFSQKNLINYYVNDELDYNEWTPELGSKFETVIASTFFQKFSFVNFNGAICSLLGQPQMNGVTKLKNGHLITPLPFVSDETLKEYSDSTAMFHEYLQEKSIPLLYVSPPYNNSKFDPQLPTGINDYCNDDIDRFLSMLTCKGIEVIDLRKTMQKDGLDHYDYMYKTDHHWTTKAGLYAYSKIENYIVQKTRCIVDPRISNINNYTVSVYKNAHLGSNGQRTGKYYAGIDDFELIIPNFQTFLINDFDESGRMEDLVIDNQPLTHNDITSRYTYDNVLSGALNNYTNPMCKNKIKVLLIADSYARAVNPYLAIGFYKTTFVYNMDVSSLNPAFIEDCNPDVVIMMYYPGCLFEGGKPFSFHEF